MKLGKEKPEGKLTVALVHGRTILTCHSQIELLSLKSLSQDLPSW